ALALYDLRNFPFQSNIPGVEGHATILDNLLSLDPLSPGTKGASFIWVLGAMTVGAGLFSYFAQALGSLSLLGLFALVIGTLALIDLKILFQNNYLLETSFLYLELASIFVLSLAVKY